MINSGDKSRTLDANKIVDDLIAAGRTIERYEDPRLQPLSREDVIFYENARRTESKYLGFLKLVLQPTFNNGWMPVEIDGERCMRHHPDTLIDIKIDNGVIFYGVIAGNVCLALEKPTRIPERPYFNISSWNERWWGVVTAYRLHSNGGSQP